MQSPQEARPSENPDSSSFIQSLFESDDWQFGVSLVLTHCSSLL
ncbi:BnaCnng24810D [Brassica napus]|uniref:BnaC08g15490D protein n=1 Tax=Brassica napus TaxID=3708 RepID=A0A078IV79_BRANA|nr:BnaC08g15490D [Brassica napus]CDY53319.1 BnaCnng24810D [Brassica napus]